MTLRLTLLVLSFLILGAHFLREGSMLLVLLSLLAPLLLFIRRRWVLIAVQVLLYCGVLVWIDTLVDLIRLRLQHDAPWLRMALILGAVILVTAYSGLMLNSKMVVEKYHD